MDPQSPHASNVEPQPPQPPPWPPAEAWQAPQSWPPAQPPPHIEPEPGSAGRRRWPVAGLVAAVLIMALLGVAAGASAATSAAASTAARLVTAGEFGTAIAMDEQISERTGLLYVFDGSAASGAVSAAERTLLLWAAALGRAGHIDAAVALYRSEQAPSLRLEATNALAALLLTAAAADVAHGAYPSAILRLQQIEKLAGGTPAALQAERQLPVDQTDLARALIAEGYAADAVATLDAVVKEGSVEATRTADGIYPTALLAAAKEAITDHSDKEAVADLQLVVSSFPQSAQATQARALLGAPQTVSGTLVNSTGSAIAGPVRLSTHYTAEPGGLYQTSGPFFHAAADASGDFIFTGVPIGGPYVLEVFTGGNWTTLIDPTTHEPAHPVTVTALIPVDLTFVVLPS